VSGAGNIAILNKIMTYLRGRTVWQLALVAVLAGIVVAAAATMWSVPVGVGSPLPVALGLIVFVVALLAGIVATRAANASNSDRISAGMAELSRREAELRATLENMLQGVAMYDAEYRLVTWNQKFRDYLDMPDEFFDGRHTFADYIRYLAKRGEFGEVHNIEGLVAQRLEPLSRKHSFERVRPDGTVLEVFRNPIPGGGFIAIYTDITARSQTEGRLREHEEQFRAIDNAAPIAMVIVRVRDQHIQHVNPYFCKLLEMTAASVLDRPVGDVFADKAQGQALATLLARGPANAIEQELHFVRHDGEELWVIASVEQLKFHSEFAMIACLSNITDRKRAEVELVRAKEAAAAAASRGT
jgi:PAS domain S-box-containing protein